MPQIRVLPIDRNITFEEGESASLLALLASRGVAVESECGGRGKCAKCLVELIEGSLLELEGPGRANPVHDRLFLACRCRPQGDCVIRVREPGEARWLIEGLIDLELAARTGEAVQRLGVAVDVGTTTVVAMLIDIEKKRPIALQSETNPQRAYGADVISRIAHAVTGDGRGTEDLRDAVVGCVNRLIEGLIEESGQSLSAVEAVVCAGNTAMQHFLLGIEPRSLGKAPYTEEFLEAEPRPAADAGIKAPPNATLFILPNIGSFIGGDTVGCLLAIDETDSSSCRMMVDLGTNTEIVLQSGTSRVACSAAAGPAFEGAHIEQGMRATPGAISGAHFEDGTLSLETVGGSPAVGICGSGMVDVTAALRKLGVVDAGGRMREYAEYLLVEASRSGTGADITITRKDIREIQLVKASIATGVTFLLEELGVEHGSLERFYVCGAFGNYLDVENAIRIGLLPNLPLERFVAMGDGALKGAFICLTEGKPAFEVAKSVARGTVRIELAGRPDFQDRFLGNLDLEAHPSSGFD